jgi:hypothetical protein
MPNNKGGKNYKKSKNMESIKPTRDQLIECFDCVFTTVHSPGFKESEMKDLIYDSEYGGTYNNYESRFLLSVRCTKKK